LYKNFVNILTDNYTSVTYLVVGKETFG
jgi:hypothetical protein